MKTCKRCNTEKPDEEFEIKYAPYSKFLCKECYRLGTIERQKKSYEKLREKRLEYQKQYDSTNPRKEFQKQYRLNNKEKIKKYMVKQRELKEENKILEKSVELWNLYLQLETQLPKEQAEMKDAIRKIQNIMGKRIIHRLHPHIFPNFEMS